MNANATIRLVIAYSDTGVVDHESTHTSLNDAMRTMTQQAAEWPGVFVNDGLDHNGINWDVASDDQIIGSFITADDEIVAGWAIEQDWAAPQAPVAL